MRVGESGRESYSENINCYNTQGGGFIGERKNTKSGIWGVRGWL